MKTLHPIAADLSGDLRARVLELCKCAAIAAQYGQPAFTLDDGRSIRLRRDGGASCLTFVAEVVELAGGYDPALWANGTPEVQLRQAGLGVREAGGEEPGDIVCLTRYRTEQGKSTWGPVQFKVPTARHVAIMAPFNYGGKRFMYHMGGARVEGVCLDDYMQQTGCEATFFRPG